MKILVDADACPVVEIIENIASEKHLKCLLFCDMSHYLISDYSEVIMVDQGADAVDFALLKRVDKHDIVITQDYGLATLVLTKQAKAIHPSGKVFTQDNVDEMLFGRYLSKKIRESKTKHHLRGPRKRTREDDVYFEKQLLTLIETVD